MTYDMRGRRLLGVRRKAVTLMILKRKSDFVHHTICFTDMLGSNLASGSQSETNTRAVELPV